VGHDFFLPECFIGFDKSYFIYSRRNKWVFTSGIITGKYIYIFNLVTAIIDFDHWQSF
jgi:hypothetical protein